MVIKKLGGRNLMIKNNGLGVDKESHPSRLTFNRITCDVQQGLSDPQPVTNESPIWSSKVKNSTI
jgi:hypothetical protein